ncbi:MAG TPA: ATP-binding protein [Opitutaceae bacterium]|nr:ATP-binding protein [Opitutaceae bacterium]
MISLPTLPQRTWLERVSLAVECLLIAFAGLTIAGWAFRIDPILLPRFLGHTPFKANDALGLGLLAIVVIGIEFGHRRLAVLALIPGAIGGATLAQFAFGLELRIDEFLAHDYLTPNTGHPGRMSAVSAVCLLVGSMPLLWQFVRRAPSSRPLVTAAAGSLVASAAFSTLVGYAAALPAVSSWGLDVATSPVSAIGLVLFGLALISLAWRESLKETGEAPAWSPMPVVVGCLTLTLVLWVGLAQRESAYIGANTATAMDRFVTNVQAEVDRQVNQFERMASSSANLSDATSVLWEADARAQWANSADKGCRMIEYLDRSGRTVWVFPKAGNEGAPGFDHNSVSERRDALLQARQTHIPVISATTRIITAKTSERGFVIYAPILHDGVTVGYIAGEFAYQPLFENIAARENTTEQYQIAASITGEAIYLSAYGGPRVNPKLTGTQTYTIADRRVKVSFTPLPVAITRDHRYLPELALAAGFGITALFGISVHLARRARAGQRAAELSNKRLFAENEERRRVEARLKISDERLRLALDSTQIGIFEWSVAAGHVYYSPGLWAMLGYDHARMPSTTDSWQSLIHPDDLAVYRQGIESQLNGSVSFIEPEYRVRARTGEWRWVYTRSKSVASGADGRPIRIVGSVQDITARRDAELALRASQAEARKLSLVAAKTDNPVLIMSADGRIEWANLAFCRVMEYPLEEVVGRNPADFMVGPETSARVVGRIRSALTRAEGISTDVVNYSRSGRKFHLHVEIQPVRDARGELMNFIAVETDITARVETEHQLRRAKTEADDASRAKSEFLASMSHEIRTPMNGVIGMTSLLMETSMTPEQRDYVNTIRTSGEALLTIINDILDFSKIESGKLELERAPFDIAGCLEEALDLFALQAAAKRLEIGYYMAPDVPPWIVGDVTRLRQVLVNLVNNAVKFTPSGSISVEVRCAPEQRGLGSAPEFGIQVVEFTVRDTGIGIPADRVDRLFKAFSQIDSSTTRKYGGTGLGLAICQRLTQLMGGDIRVESSPGQGSAFIFTLRTTAATESSDPGLPAVPAALREGTVLCIEDNFVTQARLRTMFKKVDVDCIIMPDARSALTAAASLPKPPVLIVVDGGDVEGAISLESLTSVVCPRLVMFPFGQTPPEAPTEGPPLASTSKPLRTGAFFHAIASLFQPALSGAFAAPQPAERPIGDEIPLEVLLAEDNPVNQKVALRFLERLGYRADAVANGLEAVTAVENRRYDLVLMDLQMPEMDGFEATRQIRTRLSAERQPKIVALTANAMQGDRDMCLAAGMDDYISKPVKIHEIAAAIRRHFAKSQEFSAPPSLNG